MGSEALKLETNHAYVSNRNSCKLCAPLGACFAFRGVEGCIPLIHGSQGCATYIRRYGISHFREPIDIASSNFTETSAIFGGKQNLSTALDNVTRQYKPSVVGIASTCLSETIGDNVDMYISEYKKIREDAPALIYAATPSYSGSHMDGYHEALWALVKTLTDPEAEKGNAINLISGFVSTEDLRELHAILSSFGLSYTLLPDYSESLDGGSWEDYQKMPVGGTPVADIKAMGKAEATIYLGKAVKQERNAGYYLQNEFDIPLYSLDLPIGIELTDRFFEALEEATGNPMPTYWAKARSRLVDAYIDGHKYCSGKKAIVYGDEDFVCAMVSFLDEIGISTPLVATGAPSASFKKRIKALVRNGEAPEEILDDTDFETMLELAGGIKPELVIGNSKGYYLARNLHIPHVRCSFPIHDRIGGQRVLHLGYRGALHLFDEICNALMQAKQEAAHSGYTYI